MIMTIDRITYIMHVSRNFCKLYLMFSVSEFFQNLPCGLGYFCCMFF